MLERTELEEDAEEDEEEEREDMVSVCKSDWKEEVSATRRLFLLLFFTQVTEREGSVSSSSCASLRCDDVASAVKWPLRSNPQAWN